MNRKLFTWGLLGIAPLIGAIACSGKNVNEVGDINSGGHAGASGSSSFGGADIGAAGAPDPVVSSGAAGNSMIEPGGGDAGSVGGSGGAAGAPVIMGPEAGAGGDVGDVFECATCTVVADDQDVHGVSVSGGKVYWVTEGKTDHLGNYDFNGRLFERDVTGGAQSLIVDGLTRPDELSVNGDYAYLVVNRASQPGVSDHVLRVPLAGGNPVQLSTSSSSDVVSPRFSAAPGYEYWILEGGVVRAATTADALKETVLSARGVQQITNDGTTLFFVDSTALWSMPLAGGDPVQIYAYDSFDQESPGSVTTAGTYVYAVRLPGLHSDDPNFYLVRMPKTGGNWTRLSVLAPAIQELAVDGDRTFFAGYSDGSFNIIQSSVAAPETQTEFLSNTNTSRRWFWAVSATGLFYGSAHGLYFTPGAP